MWIAVELLLTFVALYPIVTAALWVAGGLLFRALDERCPSGRRTVAGRASAC